MPRNPLGGREVMGQPPKPPQARWTCQFLVLESSLMPAFRDHERIHLGSRPLETSFSHSPRRIYPFFFVGPPPPTPAPALPFVLLFSAAPGSLKEKGLGFLARLKMFFFLPGSSLVPTFHVRKSNLDCLTARFFPGACGKSLRAPPPSPLPSPLKAPCPALNRPGPLGCCGLFVGGGVGDVPRAL